MTTFTVSSGQMNTPDLGSGDTETVQFGGLAISGTVASGGLLTDFGTASAVAILTSGTLSVGAGGVESGATLTGGPLTSTASGTFGYADETVLSGGVAKATVVDNDSILYLYGSGVNATLSGVTTVSSGGTYHTAFEKVMSGGVAVGTQVRQGGALQLSGGTTSFATVSGAITVTSGQYFALAAEVVSSGGMAVSTTISDGGQLDVRLDGVSSDAVISGTFEFFSTTISGATAYELVSAGGSAVDTHVGSGGGVSVKSDGTTTGTMLSGAQFSSTGGFYYAAYEIVSAGGTASSTMVGSGGKLGVIGHSFATTVAGGGRETVSSGGIASGTVVSGVGSFTGGSADFLAASQVLSAGTAIGTQLGSGGRQSISAGGMASQTVVSSGGTEVIHSGGSASGTLFQLGGRLDLPTLAYGSATAGTVDQNDVLTVTEGTVSYTQQLVGSYAGETFQAVQDSSTGTLLTVACYCPGTLIRTPGGEVAVECLAIGDPVLTLDGSAEPVRWIGRRSYAGRFLAGRAHLLPVRIHAGALGGGLPRRDLVVSPAHALYLDGVLVPAGDIVNATTIVRERGCDRVDYLHIELARHAVIWAEGAPAESFVDDDSRGMFQNAAEYSALYPDAEPPPVRFCAPRVSDGYQLEQIRTRLAVQAA